MPTLRSMLGRILVICLVWRISSCVKLPQTSCRVIVMNTELSGWMKSRNSKTSLTDVFKDTQTLHVNRLNCTRVHLTNVKTACEDNKNCSDIIMSLQANEDDFYPLGALVDHNVQEVATVGPTVGYLAGVVVNKPEDLSMKWVMISDVVHKFNGLVGIYMAIVSYLTFVISTVVITANANKLITIGAKEWYEHLWKRFENFVNQGENLVTTIRGKILWMSHFVLIFILVDGYFCNLWSTDLVAAMPVKRIDSIVDLYSPYFFEMPVIMTVHTPIYSIIESSSPGTELNLLYKKILKTSSKTLIKTSFGGKSLTTEARRGILSVCGGESAFIANRVLWETYLKQFMCLVFTTSANGLHESQPFSEQVTSVLFSKTIEEDLKRYLHFRVTKLFEMKIMPLVRSQLVLDAAMNYGAEQSWDSMICFHKLFDHDTNADHVIVRMAALQSTLVTLLVVLLLATIMVMFEFIASQTRQKGRRTFRCLRNRLRVKKPYVSKNSHLRRIKQFL